MSVSRETGGGGGGSRVCTRVQGFISHSYVEPLTERQDTSGEICSFYVVFLI